MNGEDWIISTVALSTFHSLSLIGTDTSSTRRRHRKEVGERITSMWILYNAFHGNDRKNVYEGARKRGGADGMSFSLLCSLPINHLWLSGGRLKMLLRSPTQSTFMKASTISIHKSTRLTNLDHEHRKHDGSSIESNKSLAPRANVFYFLWRSEIKQFQISVTTCWRCMAQARQFDFDRICWSDAKERREGRKSILIFRSCADVGWMLVGPSPRVLNWKCFECTKCWLGWALEWTFILFLWFY